MGSEMCIRDSVKGISKFIKQSSVKSALDKLGFDCDSMASYIREIMEE